MKYALVLVFRTFIFTNMYGQSKIKFEPGYFIDNAGDTTYALIQNRNWIYSPERIDYKLNDSSAVLSKPRAGIKEFVVPDLKYVRQKVLIDRSGEGLNSLTKSSKPYFVEEELFLEVLVEGAAELYKFRDRRNIRFFFKTADQSLTQLVYKKYFLEEENMMRENAMFRQQLSINLVCSFTEEEIIEVEYEENDLKSIFIRYSECEGNEIAVYSTNKKSKVSTRLAFKGGYRGGQLISEFTSGSKFSLNVSGIEIGLEYESVYFGKPWSIIVNPNINILKSVTGRIDSSGVDIGSISKKYSELNLGFHFRNYFFANNDDKLFIQAGLEFGWPINSDVTVAREKTEEVQYRLSVLKIQPKIGVGYAISDKIRIGLDGTIKSSLFTREFFSKKPDFQFGNFQDYILYNTTYRYYSINVLIQF